MPAFRADADIDFVDMLLSDDVLVDMFVKNYYDYTGIDDRNIDFKRIVNRRTDISIGIRHLIP